MDYRLVILLVVLIFTYIWYVLLIKRRNQVLECLSGIDVQIAKRHDLIPNILNIAKKFMEHESTLMTEVTALRAKISKDYLHNNKESVAEYFEANNKLAAKMANLFMQVENYPNLKSDQAMLQAQITYNEVEEHISAARRFYNSSVTQLNNSIQIFPGNLIAKIAKVELMPFFHVLDEQKKTLDANKILS